VSFIRKVEQIKGIPLLEVLIEFESLTCYRFRYFSWDIWWW